MISTKAAVILKRDSKTLPHWPNRQPLALWAITVWEAYERERERERERAFRTFIFSDCRKREREKERDALRSTGLSVDVNVTWTEWAFYFFFLLISIKIYILLSKRRDLSEKATDYYDYVVVDLTICYCISTTLAVHQYVFCMTKLALSFLYNDRSYFLTFKKSYPFFNFHYFYLDLAWVIWLKKCSEIYK